MPVLLNIRHDASADPSAACPRGNEVVLTQTAHSGVAVEAVAEVQEALSVLLGGEQLLQYLVRDASRYRAGTRHSFIGANQSIANSVLQDV